MRKKLFLLGLIVFLLSFSIVINVNSEVLCKGDIVDGVCKGAELEGAKIHKEIRERIETRLIEKDTGKEVKRILIVMKKGKSFDKKRLDDRIGFVDRALKAVGLSPKVKFKENIKNLAVIEYDLSDLDILIKISKEPDVGYIMEEPILYLATSDVTRIIGSDDINLVRVNATPLDGKGYTVCLLDSGVDYTHPDLQDYVILGPDTRDDDGDPMDSEGHGTHLAGDIHSVAPEAKIAAVRVCHTSCGPTDMAQGVQWCIDNKDLYNITAISMSIQDFGGHPAPSGACPSWMDSVLEDAKNASLFTVSASGNQGYTTGIGYPACSPYSYSTGATDDLDTIDGSSNRYFNPGSGNHLDFFAPGDNVISTKLGGGYSGKSGTSIATPFVAAASLLIHQYHALNSLATDPDIIRDLLNETGKIIGSWPRIDVKAAVNKDALYDCAENWVPNSSECAGDYRNMTYNDANACGTSFNVPEDNGTSIYCGLSECDSGLVNYWSFDDGYAEDSVGSSNGTEYNTTNIKGKIGIGKSFNGSSYITADGSTSYDIFTVALWARFNNLNNDQVLVAKQDGTGTGETWLLYDKNDNKIESWLGGAKTFTGYTPAADDTFRLYTLTYDNGWVTMYVNDILIGGPSAKTEGDATGNFVFGANKDLATQFLHGDIDEVAIFDSALSLTEIQNIYNKGVTEHNYCMNDSYECYYNIKCGIDYYEGFYCSAGDIYDNLTSYTCNSPGTSGSSCSNSTMPVLKESCSYGCDAAQCVACSLDSDCGTDFYEGLYCSAGDVYDDFTSYTCNNNGTASASCSSSTAPVLNETCPDTCTNGTCDSVECFSDTDCGTDYYDISYCSSGDVYNNFTDYTCNDPGNASSSCSNATTPNLNETCSYGCDLGFCVACSSNSDCGDNFWTGSRYCSGGDVWQDYMKYVCYDDGTVSSYCNSSFGDRRKRDCDYGCSDGVCLDNPSGYDCSVDSDCGADGLVGGSYCSAGDVYQSSRTWSCNNNGTVDAYCSYSDAAQSIENCTGSCVNGACVSNICNVAADCGADDWVGSPYCNGTDIYQSYRMWSCAVPGTDSCNYTDDGQLNETCAVDCLNGVCVDADGESGKDVDVGVANFHVQTNNVSAGIPLTVLFNLDNNGNVTINDIEWIFDSDEGAAIIGVVSELRAGESILIIRDITYSGAGTYYPSVVVDPDNNIDESNEANNQDNLTLIIP
ncbi:S8 family serine peptidase [Candidatus Woesearchaeota archaeon]|nr:S8 family serine peptidase [Candidatus Woesearchaeota archaeon]